MAARKGLKKGGHIEKYSLEICPYMPLPKLRYLEIIFKRRNTLLNKEDYISLWNKHLFQVRDYIELRGNDLCVLTRNDLNRKYNVNIDFISYHRL